MKTKLKTKSFLKNKRLALLSISLLMFSFGLMLATKPVRAAQNVITHYSAPSGARVEAVATDATGNGWFVFSYGVGTLQNPNPGPDIFHHLGRIDATTGAFTQFTVGTATLGNNVDMVAASDNNIYISIASSGTPTPDYVSKIAKFNPTNNQFTFFPVNAIAGNSYTLPERIIEGPDNNIWFVEAGANRVTKMNPANGAMTNYNDPEATTSGGNVVRPLTLTAGPDGNVWLGRANTGAAFQKKIAKIDVSSGVYTSYNIPEFTSHSQNPEPANNNAISVASLDGSIWVSAGGQDELRKVNPADGSVTATYTFQPPYDGLGLLKGGTNHALWFLSAQNNRGILGKFDTTTNQFSTFAGTQTAGNANTVAQIASLAVSNNGNKVWYGKSSEGKVGLLTVDDTVTPPPPTDPTDPNDPTDPTTPTVPTTPNNPTTPILSPKTGVIGGLIVILIAGGAAAGVMYDRNRRAKLGSKEKSEK